MSRNLVTGFVIFICLTLVPVIPFAQTRETAGMQGKIQDEEGGPLPGATLMISSPGMMGTRSALSDQEGKFRFSGLPGGTYTLEASLKGFTSVRKTDISLHVGMTVTVDFVLNMAKIGEEVTVVGAAPLIDVKSSALNKTIITLDVLENIPTPRNAYQLLNLAPGVVNMYAYGGGGTANTFQLDGVELDDAWCGSGVYATPIDYYVIEEAQVVAMGASAEYGNFTGALINVITKSGGNRLSGDALFSFQGTNWHSENIKTGDPKWSLLPESLDIRELDTSAHLGGAFIKDKLWFYGGAEYYYQNSFMKSIDRDRALKFPKIFFKLTFQLNEKNKLQAFFQHHNRRQYGTLSKFTNVEAQNDLLYPVFVGNLSFLHTFSPSTLLELKVAGYTIVWDSWPHSRDKNTAGHYDLVTGVTSVNQSWWSIWKSRRYGAAGTLSHYAENLVRGSHELKFGFELERSEGGGDVSLNGGVYYYDRNGAPYQATSYSMNEWAVHNRLTLYTQDDWKISESLVINPGLRFNIFRGSVPGLGTIYKPTNFEPRIGFTWDIFKAHRTVLKAHFGRYNEDTKTYYISMAKQSMSDQIYYSVPQWGQLIELYRIPAVNRFSVDPDIKHPYVNQFTAGIEQVLGKDWTVSIAFIYKNWNDIISPVNMRGLFVPTTSIDPETGQTYTVYNQTNPGADRYYITNPKKGKNIGANYPDIVSITPEKNYKALEFRFAKRFSHKWMLSASYVYSTQKSTFADSYGRESVFYNPNNQINLYGDYATDIPHVFKIQASVILPLDFTLGCYYLYHTGSPWTRVLYIYGLNQGAFTIRTEPPGTRRLPDASNLDLRLEKSFRIKDYRFRFMLDIFNALNQGRITSIYSTVSANFGKPTAANTPRTFRASFRFMF